MASESTNVSVVAMVVACVALVVATGQLLQQLLGTADGFRRCQRPVMGAWAKQTRRKWVWREFRFETRYQTPHLLLLQEPGIHDRPIEQRGKGRVAYVISSTPDSRSATMSPKMDVSFDRPETVSWSALLDQLHELQSRFLMRRGEVRSYIQRTGDFDDVIGFYDVTAEYGPNGPVMFERNEAEVQNMTSPAMERREWSWDLIPLDIHRPLATAGMGTLIALSHRLGMNWVDLQPHEGIMRANGNGQSISATTIRGLGLMLQYNFDRSVHVQDPAEVIAMMRVPTVDADKMGFGIIPGKKSLLFSTWDIPLISDRSGRMICPRLLSSAMERMDVLPEAVQLICDSVRDQLKSGTNPTRIPGFSDILGLWTDFIPLKSSHINTIIHPLGTRLESPFEAREGRVTWRIYLEREFAASPGSFTSQRIWVMQQLNFLFKGFRNDFLRNKMLSRGNCLKDTKLLVSLREIFDKTTQWFEDIDFQSHKTPIGVSIFDHKRSRLREARQLSGFYQDLVAAHVSVAAFSLQDAYNLHLQKHNSDSIMSESHDSLIVKQSFVYAENVGKVVKEMRRRGQIARLGYINPAYLNGELVQDAWWTMMLRAVVWFMSTHRLETDEIQPVPSYFWESSSIVYIT